LLRDARVGSQVPRVASVPRATSRALANDAIELAGEAGLHLDDWQKLVLTGGLGQIRGSWSATSSRPLRRVSGASGT